MIKNLKLQVKPIKNFGEIAKSLKDGEEIDAQTLDGMKAMKFSLTAEMDIESVQKVVKFVNGLNDTKEKK